MTLAIRMGSNPLGIAPTLRQSIGSIDPAQPVYDIETLQQALAASVAIRRFELFLLAVFATAALVMALIGVYGVIAFSVTQRTKEIGIRMALGAQRTQVVEMIASEGMKIGAWGITIGIVAAYGFTRLMVGLLYGVKPHDPVVFWSVAATLPLIVALASSGPCIESRSRRPSDGASARMIASRPWSERSTMVPFFMFGFDAMRRGFSRTHFQVIPHSPQYLLRSPPDSHRTPFTEVLKAYNGFEAGHAWIDLTPDMELSIENAYYEAGAMRSGLAGFLGTEVARYAVLSNGLDLLSVQPMKNRPNLTISQFKT